MREISVSKEVLILGSGIGGTRVSLNLSSSGLKVHLLERKPAVSCLELKDKVKQNKDINLITSGKLVNLKGQVGNFEVKILKENEEVNLKVGAIVIAEKPNFKFIKDDFGIDLSDNIITQSQLQRILNPEGKKRRDILNIARETPDNICFILSNASQEGRASTVFCLKNSLILRKKLGSEVYVLCKDLKVAGDGIEKIYRETRDSGVVFLKYKSIPEFTLDKDNPNLIIEDYYLNKKISLPFDLLILDERILPDENFKELSSILKVDLDERGFTQSENINLYPVNSNRKGIFFIENHDTDLYLDDILEEAQLIVEDIFCLLSKGKIIVEEKVSLDAGKCALCLTCVRSCPHKAIEPGFDKEADKKCAVIFPEACFGCGICAGLCPAKAINMVE